MHSSSVNKVSKQGNTFVSDKWISPSIKDDARESQSEVTPRYCIKGPGQKRPNDW